MTPARPDEVELRLRVQSRSLGADDVIVIDLVDPTECPLPDWDPGAHIDVILPSGLVRQYSLCSDPPDRSTLRIAVLREPESRGGSAFLCEELAPGMDLDVRGPRNHFALLPSANYVFVAGGIGITPILPMLSAAQKAGAAWTLHYGGRSLSSMAFVDEIRDIAGSRLHLYPQDEMGLIPLDTVLGMPKPDTLVYCCGPEPLLEAVEKYASVWPEASVHMERFGAKEFGAPILPDSFEVELARTGLVLRVPPDKSILEVLEAADVEVFSSCQDGTCGTCETPVLSGEVEHRDSIMTPEEQASNDRMYVCVSRAACPRLVLDL